jgi:hypothetical protein
MSSRFQVAATSSGGSLGCSITVEVKRPEDLHHPGTCAFVTKTKTGEVMDTNWKARIVYVEFAEGMRWTPKQQAIALLSPPRPIAFEILGKSDASSAYRRNGHV